MSENNNSSRAMQAIDALLADQPSEFRATVFELSRQLGWADDEPGFLLAIATNQLEALIRQYPERISAAMNTAARELEADWQQLQAKLALSAMKSAQTAGQIDQKLTQAQLLIDGELSKMARLLEAEQTAMAQAMTDERAAVRQLLSDERTAMAQQAQDLAEQQKQVLEARTKELIVQAVAANKERADKQVKEIVASSRAAHYWQSVGGACVGAFLVICATLFVQALAKRVSPWGQFEQWNQSQLKDCRAVDSNTCNFHIKPPEK